MITYIQNFTSHKYPLLIINDKENIIEVLHQTIKGLQKWWDEVAKAKINGHLQFTKAEYSPVAGRLSIQKDELCNDITRDCDLETLKNA